MITQMALQGNLMPNGWPLGLENMNTRLLEAADNSPQATVAASEPSSLHVPSSSFSSFSSSNLDTESTVSFFADHSVTLGRLIGINPMARQSLRFTNTTQAETEQEPGDIVSVNGEKMMTRGICVPLLRNIMVMKCKSY
ncbi:ATP synthase [Heracleum sosnowskyi]|uniref:ATP synthase n=1 Tax=Heracleum sosnowskyi TaxID=360622 RepID=A0AAD8HLV9_9APIA|nr:ATP synthase [Heracleum sosnowskyi]